MTFDEARAQFPVLARVAYLNAGTFGPLARATVDAAAAWDRRLLEQGRSGQAHRDEVRALREQVRERISALLGVDAATVALTSSTTNACNIVLAGLDLAPDDEVVTTDAEHFGLLGALHASGARVRVARVRDLPAERALTAILAEVGSRARLLALSHVSWMTGNVFPVAELKRETGLPVLVDGAQTVGAVPVNATPFDFYTVSGQKWLCGPDATGALYVGDPDRLRVAAPTYFSHRGYEPDGSFAPVEGAARFDSGWISPGSLAGLEAALDAVPEWSSERARAVAERCYELLAERFEIVTAPGQATLVSFRSGGDAAEVAASLFERGVTVRDIPGTDWVRVSCAWWTSDGDLERLLASLSLAEGV